MVNRFTERPVTLAELAGSEAAVLILAAAVVVTLVVGSLLLTLWPGRESNMTTAPPPVQPEAGPPPPVEEAEARPDSRQILRLTRNAERLDIVEQDLIRAMAFGEPVSNYTRKLLTEMRVCTCKLLGELSDIDRLNDEKSSPTDKHPMEASRN